MRTGVSGRDLRMAEVVGAPRVPVAEGTAAADSVVVSITFALTLEKTGSLPYTRLGHDLHPPSVPCHDHHHSSLVGPARAPAGRMPASEWRQQWQR